MTGAALAGTNTGDALWIGAVVGRGGRALGKGRGSSTRRVGMGGEGEENDGMSWEIEKDELNDTRC
jgi:hypothetical protein